MTIRMGQEAALDGIGRDIEAQVPFESIMLAGSRAIGQAHESSDYDILVLMKTCQVPFYLKRLKRIAAGWQAKLGVEVSINPMPSSRIVGARRNLFLFKALREARVIRGENLSDIIVAGSIEDIAADCYLSYLASAMLFLIRNYSPAFAGREPGVELREKIAGDAAKAMLYCGEVHLLRGGCYEANWQDMPRRFKAVASQEPDKSRLADDLELAAMIKQGTVEAGFDYLSFWCRVKDHVVSASLELMGVASDIMRLPEVIENGDILRAAGSRRLKNLQYMAYAFMGRREIFWRCLFSQYSVEVRVRLALIMLLQAVAEDGAVDTRLLQACLRVLKGYVTIGENRSNDNDYWELLRDTVVTYASYACTVLGV